MRIRALLMFFLMLGLFSCAPKEKDKMIAQHRILMEHMVNVDYDSIVAMLDQESLEYYHAITKGSHQNYDDAVRIGKQFKVKYLSTLFSAGWAHRLKTNKDPLEFFSFLAGEKVSFFSYATPFKIYEQKSRTGVENYVAIYKETEGQNVVSWARYTLEGAEYKYDLMYTLRFFEFELKKFHEFYLKDKTDEGVDGNLEKLFATMERTVFDESIHLRLELERRSLYPSILTSEE